MNSINDTTFASALLSLPPPNKRKRISTGSSPKADPSEIVDTRTKPSSSLNLTSPPLTIIVGPEPSTTNDITQSQSQPAQSTFYVHESALCTASPFFANAMKPEWASLRPDPRTLTLPDDDPTAFALYMSYLYAKELPILPESPLPATPEAKYRDVDDGYHTLAYAYVLGERLLDTAFKNAIIDAYVLYARGSPPARRCYPSNEEIRILYEGTHEGSPIRRLVVDIWIARGKGEWIESDPDLPREFLVEVTRGLLRCRDGGETSVGMGMSMGSGSGSGSRTRLEGLSRPWKLTHEQYYEK